MVEEFGKESAHHCDVFSRGLWVNTEIATVSLLACRTRAGLPMHDVSAIYQGR